MTTENSLFLLNFADRSVVIDLPDRKDYIQRQIAETGKFYELDVLEELGRLPLPDGVICDVGANIGNHTLYFSAFLGRRVYAFEPLKKAFALLEKNVRLNRLEAQVATLNLALGDQDKSGLMELNAENMGASRFSEAPDGDVRMTTLDSILPEGERVAVIKVDVEGQERAVLQGAERLIRRDQPLLIVEAQNHYAYRATSEVLDRFGYIPFAQKGKTATIFFVPRTKWHEIVPFSSYLIRHDIDDVRRRIQGQLDRVSRGVQESATRDTLLLDSLANAKTELRDQLVEQHAALGELNTALLSKVEEIAGRDHVVLDSLANGQTELRKHLATHNNALDNRYKSIERAISLTYDQLKAASLRNQQLDQADQKRAAQIGALEAEVARLLIVVQTERCRAQFLSRRLHTLYTTGPRAWLGMILRKLHLVSGGRISRYETWKEFELRLGVRLKRDIDDFKKMHKRINELVNPKGTQIHAPASVTISDTAISAPPNKNEFTLQRERQPVRIGIASIEIRRTALSHVVNCLYHQADEIYVYLNDYSDVPEFLKREKITVISDKGDVGDRGKFYGVDDFDGYFLSCDDDINYPPYYVSHCVDAIERYGRKAAIGWHGSLFKKPFEDYYSAESRRVFSFRSGRPSDIAVHVLGTGCTAFHTSTIKVKYDDFKTPNMADVYFALLGQHQKVPFVVIKHDAGEATPLDIPDDKPIHRESMQKTGSKADTRTLQNNLVKAHPEWNAILPPLVFNRPTPTVAYIGRIDAARWKKGGILKSGHLILDALRSLGHRVIPVEIEQDKSAIIEAVKDSEIVWIYPGDPERPDFQPVEAVIEHAASNGKQVYVNLSFNLKATRDDWIVRKLKYWEGKFGQRVKACVFTNAALSYSKFAEIRRNLICIPKTIDFDISRRANFSETSGIFLGDLQKLLDRGLVGGEIEAWIKALREELPDVPLYAVRQYGGKIDRELGLQVVPYTTGDEWNAWLAGRRISACLTLHATFEMIPIECAGMGVPVIYRPLIQAHTEALSVAGIQVATPEEFARACKALYTDSTLWSQYSDAGHFRALSQHVQFVSAAIHQHVVLGMANG